MWYFSTLNSKIQRHFEENVCFHSTYLIIHGCIQVGVKTERKIYGCRSI
jgi:hypothetical protein